MPHDLRRASDRMVETPRRSWPDLSTSGALRRRVYLWTTLLGVLVLIGAWTRQIGRPHPDLYVLFGHPVLLFQCLWIFWWLLRGRPLIVAERVVFVVNALAILTQMLLAVETDGRQMLELTSAAYWMLVAISILSFLIFSSRQALLFSAAFYVLSVGLPWGGLLLRGEPAGDYSELIRVQLTCGAVLALLSVLAWYRERFTMERGQRLSLEHLANTDPLTQLPNRRALYPEVERMLEEVRAGGTGCLILLDVDHFKRVNDTFGHNVGDEVLVRMAALMRAQLRDDDTVGRWGGEEFLITLPGLEAEVGGQVAERLRQRLAEQGPTHGPAVTASFGVTVCTADDDLQSCTARADRALYEAKTSGRNRVVTFPGSQAEPASVLMSPVPLAE